MPELRLQPRQGEVVNTTLKGMILLKKLIAWPLFHLCYGFGHCCFLWLNTFDEPVEGSLKDRFGTWLYKGYSGGMFASVFWSDWADLKQWSKEVK